MNPAVIGVFVPIILFLVIGLIAVSSGYFNYRVRQTLVDKGLDAQTIKEFLEHKRDPNSLMKIGIIAIAFGIGLGLGMALQDFYDKDYWIPFALFTFTGIGFVIANIVGRKLESKNNKETK
jgi:putative Mn2+ efflux pump MntP